MAQVILEALTGIEVHTAPLIAVVLRLMGLWLGDVGREVRGRRQQTKLGAATTEWRQLEALPPENLKPGP